MKFCEVFERINHILDEFHFLSENLRKEEFEFSNRKSEISSLLFQAHTEVSSANRALLRIFIECTALPQLKLIKGDKA
jgi:hypothetical protein